VTAMGFKLPDLTKFPIDGETCMAKELVSIEEELKHIDDPNVWHRDDGGPNGEPDGLFWELRWRASIDPTYHTADAVGLAFELGKAAASGKIDQAAVQRFHAKANAQRSAEVRKAKAKAWGAMLEIIVREERGGPGGDRVKQVAIKRLAWERMEKLIGDACPAEATIGDEVVAIEKKIRQEAKAAGPSRHHCSSQKSVVTES
jgi:hypothetical protein